MDPKIFITYSSKDQKVSTTICRALENRGLMCWISCRDIKPGQNFQEQIVKAIRSAKIMVLIFTTNSNNSNEIKKELALASQNNLIVIPVRIEDVVPNDAFAYEFATRQWIDLFDDWENSIGRLVELIAAIIDETPPGNLTKAAPVFTGEATRTVAGREPFAVPVSSIRRSKNLWIIAGLIIVTAATAYSGISLWQKFMSVQPVVQSATGDTVRPQPPIPGQPGPNAVASTKQSEQAEQAWSAVRSTTSQVVLEDFIRQFGSTEYGGLARARLEELRRNQVSIPATPVEPARPENPVSSGLVGYWPLDNLATDWKTNKTKDLSANGNDGRLVNMSPADVAPPGKVQQALSFNGNTNYVAIDSSRSFQPLTGNWSIAFRINRLGEGAGDFPQIIGSRPWLFQYDKGWAISYVNTPGMISGVSQLGHLCAHFADGKTGFDVNTSPQSCSAGTVAPGLWQHWTIVFNRASRTIFYYKDGVLDAQKNPTFPTGSIDQMNSVFIAREVEGANIRKLNAALLDVRVYDRALSQKEARELFLAGN